MSAASPDQARELYQKGLEISRSLGVVTAAGQFQADMKVTLLNDGPVTLVLES
jgi:D-tyrosyl-tRNA(Tyr) deacylase